MRDELAQAIETVGERSGRVLEQLHRLAVALDGPAASAFGDVAEDVREQIDRLVFPGFLTAVGVDRIDDVRRYVEAAVRRLGAVAENPGRDRAAMGRVRELEAELDRLVEALPFSTDMLEVAWMLQELRVSLFAQSVGAKGPVSEKRVRRAIEALVTG